MRKVSGSKPDGVQDKKKKKKAQEAWVIWRRKRGEKKEIEKWKRESARNQILFYSYGK